MQIETSYAVVILAVLVFYLRLIVLQRERAKQVRRANETQKGKGKNKQTTAASSPQYAILSKKRTDWMIAGSGVVLIILGILLYINRLPLEAAQPYWYIPTSLGIVAFSWAFKL